MKRLVVSNQARDDLKTIARYTETEWGLSRKRRYLDAIRTRFSALRREPMLGAEREDAGPGYRCLLIGRHAIFYRLTEDEVVIVRVLHQHMDVRRHLGHESDE